MRSDQHDEPGRAREWRERLRAGDVEAFTELFRAYADQVHRLAASLCADAALAEDVTGETFLTAWRRRDTLHTGDESLGPWLMGIAARQSLNATRGRRRQLSFVSRHGHRLLADTPDIADDVTARLDGAARLDRTQRAVAHLRPRELEVLALCVWSGLTPQEAARALGVSAGTVRSRLFRARARLRELTDPAEPAHGPPPRPRPVLNARPALEEPR
ncbi:RNA polymerase sigma factor [Nocardioides flavescens]|uniref:Sigma-70 family RNA polymerase sigma factor n=1 Tax=Nocardioides flavescens TaxID=2691959 RepID=A0A6L7F0T8_9ACTN|nr:sigma-70 family RNA polymerase sigma factor [Nocardioides flavescens]MXG90559.1 sigma-70 family RNA polymerase sigma factor [Nocardioides flavescens]